MKMTLDEMKLAVCEKLPEFCQKTEWQNVMSNNEKSWHYTVRRENGERREINWPTEGLQVCHEAEKLLIKSGPYADYCYKLGKIVGIDYGKVIFSITEQQLIAHATYEQRLEALCHVWWPEKWSSE